ncbi:hypothetical protein [Aureimonas sp. AU40]|uniref:hypothetical protein n=1 Tax=Aureimonas sp. AU40 TaxID=1637747 RepID=UPI00078575EF|nr:hypothetical protein [Aureimonas sp. AU40]
MTDSDPKNADDATTERASALEGVTPGGQERVMTEDEKLDEALEETFPTSDPIAPSRIDGPMIDPGKHS